MAKKDYSEDLLIQAPTAELLEQQLGWESVFAQDEEKYKLLCEDVRVKCCDAASHLNCQNARIARILRLNKTRQGYARKRILKPAGYFFVRPKPAAHCRLGGAR
jgi:hypothetical protein